MQNARKHPSSCAHARVCVVLLNYAKAASAGDERVAPLCVLCGVCVTMCVCMTVCV